MPVVVLNCVFIGNETMHFGQTKAVPGQTWNARVITDEVPLH